MEASRQHSRYVQQYYVVLHINIIIIESVDSISRDSLDTPIYIIHYKRRNNLEQINIQVL